MFPILHGIFNLTRNFVSKVPNPILPVNQNMDKEKQLTNQENQFIIRPYSIHYSDSVDLYWLFFLTPRAPSGPLCLKKMSFSQTVHHVLW